MEVVRTHTHTHTLSHTQSHTHTRTHTHNQSSTHTQLRTLTHTLTHTSTLTHPRFALASLFLPPLHSADVSLFLNSPFPRRRRCGNSGLQGQDAGAEEGEERSQFLRKCPCDAARAAGGQEEKRRRDDRRTSRCVLVRACAHLGLCLCVPAYCLICVCDFVCAPSFLSSSERFPFLKNAPVEGAYVTSLKVRILCVCG